MNQGPVPADVAATLLSLGTATLFEASKLSCALPPAIQAAWPGARVVGRALPVSTPAGDNLPLHHALEQAEPGDVVVVEAAGAPYGYWGEVMTVAAMARGIAGLVINGSVRDVDAIATHGFPMFASGRSIIGTVKQSRGRVGSSIAVGPTAVEPSAIVVGDGDGVVAIPSGAFDDVLAAARRRADAEAAYMQRLREGELTLDIYDLRSAGAATS